MAFQNAAPEWAMLVLVPALILGLVQLVCLVLVIVEMFKRGETGIGITCVVLSLCTGIGGLIAFVYGWVKSSEWGLQKVMLAWTACFALQLVLIIAAAAMGALSMPVIVQPAPMVGM